MPKGEFGRNVVTLMTGSTLAQAIPVAISPILTRMYGPRDFGLLALFVSLTTIFSAVANGRYELALLLPESDEDAINIAALGAVIALGLSLVLLVVVCLFNTRISHALDNKEIGPWLYLVPLTVFFLGIFNVLNYFNNRLKSYKSIALASVYKALVLAVVQVSVGLIKTGATGLISGQVLSSVFANAKLLKNTLASVDARSAVRWSRIRAVAWRYRDFPKYSMSAALANTLAQNLTNILVSAYYSVATLGFYSLTQRMLGMPTSLVGTSISQVFFQHATEEKRRTGKAVVAFDQTVKKLTLLSVPIFGVMFFVVEDIFALIFGEKWRIAGAYAKILTPFFAVRFVISSVSNVNNVFEKQEIALAWQLGLLILSVASIWISYYNNLNFTQFLYVLSVVSTAHYIFLYLIMRKVAGGAL
jgi:O-antigen/teichoic acid export membrane protein